MASAHASSHNFMREYQATMSKFTNPGRASRASNHSTLKGSYESSKTAESYSGAMHEPVGTGKYLQEAADPYWWAAPQDHSYVDHSQNAPLPEYGRTDVHLGSQFGGDTWSQPGLAFDQGVMSGYGWAHGNGRGRGRGRGRSGYRGRQNSRGRSRQSRGRSRRDSDLASNAPRRTRIRVESDEDPIQRIGIVPVGFGEVENKDPEHDHLKPITAPKNGKKGKFFSADQVMKLHEAEGSVPNVPKHILQRRLLEDHAELSSQAAAGKSVPSNGSGKNCKADSVPAIEIDFVVKDPDNFEVPKLGSAEMPAITLKSLPPLQNLRQQINATLKPSLRDIPPPSYPFSKKKKEETDLAAVGGIPDPAPLDLEPVANPLEESTEQERSCQEVAKEGYAESEFDGDLAEGRFVIVGETVEDASRWKWFAGPSVPQIGDPDDRALGFQLTQYDKGIEGNSAGPDAGELCYEEKDKRTWVDRWVSRMTANLLKSPYILDVANEGFTSGRNPTSGLHFNYQVFPSDLGYRPVRLFYGPINWDVIPQPKLNDPTYITGDKFNQTSQRAVLIELAKLERKLAEHEASEAARKAEARRRKNSRAPSAPKLVDTSLALTTSNPWAPSCKVHVRVAKNSDIFGATVIYNYYAKNSIDVPETVKVDFEAMKARTTATRNEGYPFLVAVLRVDKGDALPPRVLCNSSSSRQKGGAWEHVIGFARARSYNGIGTTCFDDIALLEVFVSPQYTRMRVGANLLDRLIGCLDEDYKSRQGVRIDVEPSRPKWTYNWRKTYAHVMRMYYHDVDDRSFAGRKSFLEDEFDFTEFGAFPECCSKDGGKTRYNMAFLQRRANRLASRPT